MYFAIEFDNLFWIIFGVLLVVAMCAIVLSVKWVGGVRRSARNNTDSTSREQYNPSVTILVYSCYGVAALARNLTKFLTQDYDNYEVVVVDDDVDDSSSDFLSEMMLRYKNYYYTTVPKGARNLSRRKLAITLGVKAATKDYILVTDSNCSPADEHWLSNMMRGCRSHTSLVVGASRIAHIGFSGVSRYFYEYDMVVTKVRYLLAALAGRAYRADACNMAFRKDSFFELKGFASSLNIHSGEDDIFVSEMAELGATSVSIAPEAQLVVDSVNRQAEFRENKLQHIFTSRFVSTSSRYYAALYSWLCWLTPALAGAVIYLGGLNGVSIIAAVVLLLSVWITQIVEYRKVARALGAGKLMLLVPVFALLTPIINVRFRIKAFINRKSNYTYRRKKE